ncbi:MAG: hypothetical protein H7Z42_09655 [Roseiflexaceae bacterium]|nr:hypothetical protein [Roseiflexaceae bacterium]
MATVQPTPDRLVGWVRGLGVRFLVLYFALYCVTTIQLLPFIGMLQAPLVEWAGRQVFGVDATPRQNGSGDTTFHYVQLATLAALALAGTLVWSLAARRPQIAARALDWLRVVLRFTLLLAMISYGSQKVIPAQFADPALSQLIQPVGEVSPMGLLWMFMGYSASYTVFTGLAELAGGLLLISRRTTLLGALICAGVMSQVLMLNLSYDVPVKLYSAHLLAMALFLIAPDLPRLRDFFMLNRPVQPVPLGPLVAPNSTLHIVGRVGTVLLVSAYLLVSFAGAWSFRSYAQGSTPSAELYGVWEVERFSVNGEERPPLLTDSTRWQRLVIDRYELATIQMMNDKRWRYRTIIDEGTQRITLDPTGDGTSMMMLYKKSQPEQMEVRVVLRGREILATLRRRPLPLLTRGFHWINEVPYNR